MPVQEIRESIEFDQLELDSNGFGIVQKVINLKEGVSHKMIQCDAFLDNPLFQTTGESVVMELFVTPHPVIYTDMSIAGYPSRGPVAALDTILFKQTLIQQREPQDPTVNEFPNRFISARPTFTWYMPRLYVTLLVHSNADATVSNFALSVYCAVESKKVSLVTYGLGLMRENHTAQIASVMSQGRFIPPSRNVGQIYPFWKHGGIRSEYMVSPRSIGEQFLPMDNQDPVTTNTATELRGVLKLARQMVKNPDAFGTAGTPVVGDIPDWIRFMHNEGIVSGAVRDQWPPTKYADNGNTLCL